MTTAQIATLVFVFVFAAFLMYLSVRHFLQKGRLYNNAYLHASAEEQKKLDKKPYYRQTAVIMLLLSLALLSNGLDLIFKVKVLTIASYVLFLGALVYAIVTTVMRTKKK